MEDLPADLDRTIWTWRVVSRDECLACRGALWWVRPLVYGDDQPTPLCPGCRRGGAAGGEHLVRFARERSNGCPAYQALNLLRRNVIR